MKARSGKAWGSRQVGGVVLLVIGALALLGRYASVPLGMVAPLTLGLGFLVWSLVTRNGGLLIPGGILTGLGVGFLMERWVTAGLAADRAAFLLSLAGGFALITVLGRAAFGQRLHWPLVPAVALAVLALVQLAGVELRQASRLLSQLWPVALLAVGAWLLLVRPRRR